MMAVVVRVSVRLKPDLRAIPVRLKPDTTLRNVVSAFRRTLALGLRSDDGCGLRAEQAA